MKFSQTIHLLMCLSLETLTSISNDLTEMVNFPSCIPDCDSHSPDLSDLLHSIFHHIAYDYSHADWDDLCDRLRAAPWESMFKLSTSAAASGFKLELIHISLNVSIS